MWSVRQDGRDGKGKAQNSPGTYLAHPLPLFGHDIEAATHASKEDDAGEHGRHGTKLAVFWVVLALALTLTSKGTRHETRHKTRQDEKRTARRDGRMAVSE